MKNAAFSRATAFVTYVTVGMIAVLQMSCSAIREKWEEIGVVKSAYAQTTSLQVFIRDEALHDPNHSQPRIYIKNTSSNQTVSNFKVHYYFTVENGGVPALGVYWAPGSQVSMQQVQGNIWRVVYDFNGTTLGPGQLVPDSSGNVIGLNNTTYTGWNEANDWSASGVTSTFKQTTRVAVVSSNGTLIYGQLPPQLPSPGDTGSTNTSGSSTSTSSTSSTTSNTSSTTTSSSSSTSSNSSPTSSTATSSSSSSSSDTGSSPGSLVTFTIKHPHQLRREDLALSTTGGDLWVNDDVRVLGMFSSHASVSAVEGGKVARVGVESEALHVYGETQVSVADRATIFGDVRGGALDIATSANVLGDDEAYADFEPLQVIEWEVQFPTLTPPEVQTQPDTTLALAPGDYGLTKIERGVHLTLTAGTYTFDKLFAEPGSVFHIQNGAAPVYLYVRKDFAFRGTQVLEVEQANVLLGAAGDSKSILERAWSGVVVVPNAELELATLATGDFYSGAFFAKRLTVQPHTEVFHQPFSPSSFCEASSECSSFCPCGQGQRCTPSIASPCEYELICIDGNGTGFGLPEGTSVCVPEHCAVNPNGPDCKLDCVPDCADVTCGGDLDDGCGGTCPGMCEDGQTGCQSDADCQAGSACFSEDGAPTCRSALCADPGFAAQNCGPDSPCGDCRACEPACEGQECGTDGCGGVCPCFAPSYIKALTSVDNTQAFRDTLLGLVAPPTPEDDQPNAGGLSGSFAVTDQGGAQYNIPLVVPPGIRGMQPELALVYNNSKRTGALGIGWSLSGLSRITRCNRTTSRDGYAAPVALDADDAYCLDEKRIFRKRSADGSHWTEEAYSEVETFSRIRFVQETELGPRTIEVYLKDGSKLTFGETSYEQVVVDPEHGTPELATLHVQDGIGFTRGVRRVWALSKVEDRWGNFMVVRYRPETDNRVDSTMAELNPLEILYGQMTALDERMIQRVTFEYGAYWAGRTSFVSGGPVYQRQLLSRIVTSSNGQLVREYNVAYRNNEFTGGSPWVNSVQTCSGEGQARVCLDSVGFSYGSVPDLEDSFTPEVLEIGCTGGVGGNCPGFRSNIVDIDGDGDDDIVTPEGTLISDATGSRQWQFSAGPGYGETAKAFVDIGEDGRQEIVTPRKVLTWNGAGFDETSHWFADLVWQFPEAAAGDFEGDGRQDWLFRGVSPSSGLQLVRGSDPSNSHAIEWSCSNDQRYQVIADVDGDREDELICAYNGRISILYDAFPAPSIGVIDGIAHSYGSGLSVLDWNGDGLKDLMVDGETIIVSNGMLGLGLERPTIIEIELSESPSHISDEHVVVDIDDDGRDEILFPYLGKLLRSSGTRMDAVEEQVPSWPKVEFPWSGGPILRGDLDADGDVELVRLEWRDSPVGVIAESRLRIASLPTAQSGLLTTIRDGMRNRIDIDYTALLDGIIPDRTYKKLRLAPDVGARLLNAVTPLVHKVRTRQMSHDPNITAQEGITQLYQYNDAQIELGNGAWLGFGSRTVRTTSPVTREVRLDYYNDAFWRAGKVKRATTRAISGTELGQDVVSRSEVVESDWSERTAPHSGRKYPWQERTRRALYDKGALVGRETTHLVPDDWGNLTHRLLTRTTASGVEVSRVDWTAEYESDEANWLLENRTLETITSTKGGETKTLRFGFVHRQGTPEVEDVFLEPEENGDFYLRVHHIFEPASGNIVRTEYHNAAGLMRAMDTFYDRHGLFPSSIRYSDQDRRHHEQMAFDPSTGAPVAEMDANGLVSAYFYDVHGRVQHVVSPTETVSVSRSRQGGPGAINSRGVVGVTERSSSGTWSSTLFDGLGRAIRSRDLNGEVETHRFFDGAGRMISESDPADAFGEERLHLYLYDELDRVLSAETPDGRVTNFDYSTRAEEDSYLAAVFESPDAWFGTKTTLPDGSASVSVVGPSSLPVLNAQVSPSGASANRLPSNGVDAARTSYSYGAMNHLSQVVDPDGNLTSFIFDKYGRSESVTDATTGTTTTSYNELGEIVSTVDANQVRLCNRYDSLGRQTELVRASSTGECPSTGGDALQRHIYDDAPGMIGALVSAQQRRNPDISSDWVTRSFAADPSTGRLVSVSLELPELPNALTTSFAYDGPYLKTITYPTASGGVAPVVEYEYFPTGLLKAVKDHASGRRYWEVTAQKLSHLPTEELFGNNATQSSSYNDLGAATPNCTREVDGACSYDGLHALIVTSDSGSEAREVYTYDRIARLTNRVATNPGIPAATSSFGYDGLGRLRTYEPGDGAASTTYSYSPGGDLTSVRKGQQNQVYTYGSYSRKHLLTELDGASFSYDGKGNQTAGMLGSGVAQARVFDYSNRPLKFTTAGETTLIDYDAFQSRVLKQGPSRTKMYSGGLWECEGATPQPESGGDGEFACDTERFMIYAGPRLVAQVERRSQEDTIHYVHTDRLGSVWQVTDESGEIVESRSYDAFGAASAFSVEGLSAGYTSHEHDVDLELINMGGRLYDPSQRRFISPDPFVNPSHAQGWNRFSYVRNDPINAVDPSGFQERPNIGGQPSPPPPPPQISISSAGISIGVDVTVKDPRDLGQEDVYTNLRPQPGSNGRQEDAPAANTVKATQGPAPSGFVTRVVSIQGAGMFAPSADGGGPSAQLLRDAGYGSPSPGSGDPGVSGSTMVAGSSSGAGSTSGSGGNGGGLSGAMMDSGMTGSSSGWALAGEIALGLIPFGQAAFALSEGNIGQAAMYATVDAVLLVCGAYAVKAAVGWARASIAAQRAARVFAKCFAGETEVLTREGLKAISEVRSGDEVWSFDTELGVWEWNPVQNTFEHPHQGPLFALLLGDMEIRVTGNHPICVSYDSLRSERARPPDIGTETLGCGDSARWVEAQDLEPGDLVLGAGGLKEVRRIERTPHSSLVYNLQVAKAHTYVVGSSSDLLVHNKSARAVAVGIKGFRVVNTKMGHAAKRAVERAGFASEREATSALREFGEGITQNGLPSGTVLDSAGHLVVPGFGQAGAVVYRQNGGKLVLQTVLNWVSGKGNPLP